MKAQLGARTSYNLTDVNFVIDKKKKSVKNAAKYAEDKKEVKNKKIDKSFNHTIRFLILEISTKKKLLLLQSYILVLCYFL